MDSNVVVMSEEDGLITLSGPGTFSYKSKYRAMGFKWKSDIKKWVHPDCSELMKGQLRLLMGEDLLETHSQNNSRISFHQQPSRISYGNNQQRQQQQIAPPPMEKRKPIQKGDAHQPSIHVIFDGEDDDYPPQRNVLEKQRRPEQNAKPQQKSMQQPVYRKPQLPPKTYDRNNQQKRVEYYDRSFEETDDPVVFSEYGEVDLEVYNPNDYIYY